MNENLLDDSEILMLSSVQPSELETVFTYYSDALYHYIDEVFGWDESFQRHRLLDVGLEGFYWVTHKQVRIGIVWINVVEQALHLHLLLVFSQWQNQGYGHTIVAHLKAFARQRGLKCLTLSSFIKNQGAIRFYQRQGFDLVERETHFVNLRHDLNNARGESW